MTIHEEKKTCLLFAISDDRCYAPAPLDTVDGSELSIAQHGRFGKLSATPLLRYLELRCLEKSAGNLLDQPATPYQLSTEFKFTWRTRILVGDVSPRPKKKGCPKVGRDLASVGRN